MTIMSVYLKTTNVILSMTVEIRVMKKDVVYTVRVTIIVSLCIALMYKYCPSYILLKG